MNQIPAPRSRHRDANPDRGRPAGRVRRAAGDHRVRTGTAPRDVRQNPHRQPRRDRAPGAARLPGARHPDGRGALDRRRRRHACAARRRERLHRPAAGEGQLSQHPGAARRLRDHRRRRRASGLRLSLGERPLCRNPRRAQHPFHRPEGRAHPPDGRQDRGQAHRQGARHPLRAGLRRRRHVRRRRARASPARSAFRCW